MEAFVVVIILLVVFGSLLKSMLGGGGASSGGQPYASAFMPGSASGSTLGDPFPDYDRLAAEGAPARGIVIASRPYPQGSVSRGRSFEQFQVLLDVEPAGAPPYEVRTVVFLPRGLVSMIPGSALELRVDARNPNRFAIVGPAGFTGPWLRAPADFLAEIP